MTKLLVWWQIYKAAIAGGRSSQIARQLASEALTDYSTAKALFGKDLV